MPATQKRSLRSASTQCVKALNSSAASIQFVLAIDSLRPSTLISASSSWSTQCESASFSSGRTQITVKPLHQGKGFGSIALGKVLAEADINSIPVRLGALRGSDSNRFYLRHGFVKTHETEWDIYYVRDPIRDRA
jgi:GNAT superfamily N-acetyltransferase